MQSFDSPEAILDFAIASEAEARDFYNDLAEKVENQNVSDMFKQFADEEQSHKDKLEDARDSKILVTSPGTVMDLKIADYIVAKEPTPGMGYQEALMLAMNKEKAAFKLYLDLSEQAGDANLKTLFLALAQEEAKHKLRFEIEYDDNVLTEN
ncbi:ferritin family protein [Candidatus Latescibacterota bacterium]